MNQVCPTPSMRFMRGLRARAVVAGIALLLVHPATVRADATDDFVREQMKRQNIPGLALAVVKDGRIVKAQGYGVGDLAAGIAVSPDSVFKIGSVSKQFIATGVMVLAQDGRLNVTDLVAKYISDVPQTWGAITIRHLLTHTAGLPREAPAFDPNIVQKDAELIRSAYTTPLRFPPGQKWEYSNLGYQVLAEIITRVSGRPWSVFINERVFTSAGMTSTRTTGDAAATAVVGYTDNDKLTPAANWKNVRPSGAFVSTVVDLARWDAVLYTDAVLKGATRREMWTPVTLNDGTTYGYGYGWYLNRPQQRGQVWHGGGLPGFVAQFRRYIDDRVTIIVLMNSDDVDDETIAFGIAERHLPERK